MGVIISYKFTQRKIAVKNMLDCVEQGAKYLKEEQSEKENVKISIYRYSDYHLRIDIGGCESLVFEFYSVKQLLDEHKKDGWTYPWAVLVESKPGEADKELDEGYDIERYPQNELYYCAGFCKTQFCGNIIEHKWVADLIRIVAGRCYQSEVNDEGDYFYTNDLGDARSSIIENGLLIESVGKTLEKLSKGNAKIEIIKGGETKIK